MKPIKTMLDPKVYANYEKLIKKEAYRAWMRLVKVGISIDVEDVEQEMTITYLKLTREGYYDESKGQFSTYLVMCLRNNYNKVAERLITERVHYGVRSFEEMSPLDPGDSDPYIETVRGVSENPCDTVERLQHMRQTMRKLSPSARKVVGCLISPPADMPVQKRMNIGNAGRYLRMGVAQMTIVRNELRAITAP